MKLILNLILIGILSYYVEQWLPWWSIAVVSALICFFIPVGAIAAFVSAFLGIGGMWLCVAGLLHKQSALTAQIAPLIGLENATQLVIVTALLGGSVGGIAGLTGHSARKMLSPRKTNDKALFQ